MRDYTKIVAWQKADDLTVAVYEKTRCFPREEVYALTNQLRRAAYSVPANIVEGAARDSKRDYLHFLYIARGSLNETRYFIHLAHRLRYLNTDQYDNVVHQADEALRVLAGLIGAVERDTGKVGQLLARVTSSFLLTFGPQLLGLVPRAAGPVSNV